MSFQDKLKPVSTSTPGFQAKLKPVQVQAPAPEPKKDGFLKSLAKDVAGTLVVKPIARATELATRTFAPNSMAAKGYREGGTQKVLGIDVSEQKRFGQGGAKQIFGDALKAGSFFVGGGAGVNVAKSTLKGQVLQGMWQGARGGALSGTMYGAGEELQNTDSTVGSVAKESAIGGALGLAGGAVLGGVLPVPAAAYRGGKELLDPNKIMQRVARINALDQEKFAKTAGESVGEYLVKRGIYGDDEKIIQQLADRFTKSKSVADESIAKLQGTWKDGTIEDVLNELGERELRISTTNVPSKDLNRIRELGTKYNKQGLTMSEINEVKRMYERNVKLGYLKENNTEGVARATNLDDALREWQFAQAEKLGLKNLAQINRETRLARQLGDALFKKNERSGGNNAFGLTDAVLISGGDPQAIAMLLTKKTFGSKNLQSAVAQKLAPKPTVGQPTAVTAPVNLKNTVQDVNLPKPNTGIPSVIMGTQNKKAPRTGTIPVTATDAILVPEALTIPGNRPFGELNFKTKESTVPVRTGTIPVTQGSSKPKSPQVKSKVKSAASLPSTILGKSEKSTGDLGTAPATVNKKERNSQGGYTRNPFSKENQGVSSDNNTTRLGLVLPKKVPTGTPQPTIRTKREVTGKTVSGEKFTVPAGTVIESSVDGAKVNITVGGKSYVIPKNQYQNLVGQSDVAKATPFAPELEGTVETVLSSNKAMSDKKTFDALLDERQKYERDSDEWNKITEKLESFGEDKYQGSKPKYSQYTLPGGENYREILIKAPVKTGDVSSAKKALDELKKDGITLEDEMDGNSYPIKDGEAVDYNELTPRQQQLLDTVTGNAQNTESLRQNIASNVMYQSSHWSEPNVISHIRMNDRTVDGKKYAFMEELQSDWAREGREKGFVRERTPEEIAREQRLVDSGVQSFAEGKIGTVPNNPLLKNWQIPTIKRALMEAVDSGADRFAWINGDQTSARYNLATHVEQVEWKSTTSQRAENQGVKYIKIAPKGGTVIDIDINKDGVITRSFNVNRGVDSGWEGKKLDEVLGKGLADKIMEKETGALSGDGLSFGGEWAKNLYDRQVRDIVKKLTGAEVKTVDLGLGSGAKVKQWASIESGTKLTYKQIEDEGVGLVIRPVEGGQNYVVTDLLGNGKFKAVPKKDIYNWVSNIEDEYNFAKSKGYNLIRDENKIVSDVDIIKRFTKKFDRVESFDISNPTVVQQYIDLTPEVKAKIQSKAPDFKMKTPDAGYGIPLLLLMLGGGYASSVDNS